MNPSPRRRHDDSTGFTLIEMVVVLFILGIVISMAAVLTRGVSAAQKRSITATRLAAVDAALVQYVQQQRRLPCPADGTVASTSTSPVPGIEGGRSGTGCASAGGNYETNGVVPWRALGLSETDATDGWDRRITYRIDPQLAADGALDMSNCDSAGTGGLTAGGACQTACVSTTLTTCTPPSTFLGTKGLTVKNLSGVKVMDPTTSPNTGAAYVLISAGETGGGGYLNTGTLGASTLTDGTEEAKNYASGSYVSLALTYYVDDIINDTSGATHFDDVVLRPSVMNVISRAGLGPRTH